MNEETTTRRKLIESMRLYLPVYLILISGPDLMPHIFVHHNLAPLEFGDVLSALAGYLFALAPLFLLRGIWFRCYAAALTAFFGQISPTAPPSSSTRSPSKPSGREADDSATTSTTWLSAVLAAATMAPGSRWGESG